MQYSTNNYERKHLDTFAQLHKNLVNNDFVIKLSLITRIPRSSAAGSFIQAMDVKPF